MARKKKSIRGKGSVSAVGALQVRKSAKKVRGELKVVRRRVDNVLTGSPVVQLNARDLAKAIRSEGDVMVAQQRRRIAD